MRAQVPHRPPTPTKRMCHKSNLELALLCFFFVLFGSLFIMLLQNQVCFITSISKWLFLSNIKALENIFV